MTLKLISSEAIKSPSQRALTEHWDRLAAGRHFPAFTELDPTALSHDPKQLVVWSVEGKEPRQKFRALYQGENVSQAFNSDWAGKTMEQVVPMSLRRVTLDAAKHCTNKGAAVYMIISTVGPNGQRVDCHRLLLPFGRDGAVEQILASLQLTNVNTRRQVVGDFKMQANIVFSGLIRPSATVKQPDIAVSNSERGKTEATGGRDNRKLPRRAVRRAAKISFPGKRLTCMVRDISASGASIEDANLALVPDNFRLVMEMESAERRCTVVWRKPKRIGVRFG
ncbi:PilZ domain-containing protein [Bradyrhizobium sp. 14AA]